eukprot:600843-Amphidinium_carterae.1
MEEHGTAMHPQLQRFATWALQQETQRQPERQPEATWLATPENLDYDEDMEFIPVPEGGASGSSRPGA